LLASQRKDGQVNPDSRDPERTELRRLEKLNQTVSTLTKEGAARQNHGTLYDGQVVRLALILGKTALAQRVCESMGSRRITVQIEADGRQSLELSRTKSLSYSRLNLLGLLQLATLAERVGVDLWGYRSPKGGSLRKAMDFLVPHLRTHAQKWQYKQITPITPADFAPLLRLAARGYKDENYEQVIAETPEMQRESFQLVSPRKNT
jgi:hypothetical protein